jgi:hypothetical protein
MAVAVKAEKAKVRIPSCRGWIYGVGTGECVYGEDTLEWMRLPRVVLLNAVVTRSDRPAIIVSKPVSLEEVRELVGNASEVVSYIGHEATAKLLSTLLGVEVPVSRAMYVPQRSDVAVVVRLKKRLEKPEDVKNVRPEDIEFLTVNYYDIVD